MSEEKPAALDPLDAFVQEVLDQPSEQDAEKVTIAESAPASKEEATTPEIKPVQEIKSKDEGGIEARFKKITADKYAEKNRADALQKKLDAIDAVKPKEELKKPTLEDHEFDQEAFESADRQYQIDKGVRAGLDQQAADEKAELQDEQHSQSIERFNKRIETLGNKDFDAISHKVPELPAGVANAIMEDELGPEMIIHLGSNPKEANALAGMSSSTALIELGSIKAKLSVPKEIQTSAAPDPIVPIKSGGSLNTDIGDEMSMTAWMAKYG